jgi:Leucine-rich repeat (LRR) protein
MGSAVSALQEMHQPASTEHRSGRSIEMRFVQVIKKDKLRRFVVHPGSPKSLKTLVRVDLRGRELESVKDYLVNPSLTCHTGKDVEIEILCQGNQLRRFIDDAMLHDPNVQLVLRKATVISLGNNRLEEIPEEAVVWASHVLKNFDVSNNSTLGSIPEALWQCFELMNAGLSNCNLHTLSRGVGNLTNLKCLGLYGNRLTALPSEIGLLLNLEKLDLSSNLLTELPESFGNLESLEWCNITSNRLKRLPKSIGNLKKLVEFGLGANNLSSLPVELAQCSSLKLLPIYGSDIQELPIEFTQLHMLEKLDLADNQLKCISKAFFFMPNLQYLNVCRNGLCFISDADSKPKTIPLQYVDVSGNHLTHMPASVLLKCPIIQFRGFDNPWTISGFPCQWMVNGVAEMPTLATLTANHLLQNLQDMQNVSEGLQQAMRETFKEKCEQCSLQYFPQLFTQSRGGVITMRFARVCMGIGGLTQSQLPLSLDMRNDNLANFFPIVAIQCSEKCALAKEPQI